MATESAGTESATAILDSLDSIVPPRWNALISALPTESANMDSATVILVLRERTAVAPSFARWLNVPMEALDSVAAVETVSSVAASVTQDSLAKIARFRSPAR